MLLWLCCLDIFQCLKLDLKSDLEFEFFFSKLLEGLMPIAVLSTFLTKSSLCSHLNSIHRLKLIVAPTSLCISCPVLCWTSFIYWVLSIDLHSYKTNIHQKIWWVFFLSFHNLRVTLSANILGAISGEQIEDISLGKNVNELLILKVHQTSKSLKITTFTWRLHYRRLHWGGSRWHKYDHTEGED